LPATRRCSPSAARLRSSPGPRQASAGEDRHRRLWMLRELQRRRGRRSRERSCCREGRRARAARTGAHAELLESNRRGQKDSETEGGSCAPLRAVGQAGSDVCRPDSRARCSRQCSRVLCWSGTSENGFRERVDGAKPCWDSHTFERAVRRRLSLGSTHPARFGRSEERFSGCATERLYPVATTLEPPHGGAQPGCRASTDIWGGRWPARTRGPAGGATKCDECPGLRPP
jgi:hypothetical protein